jgi:hypothetical protein
MISMRLQRLSALAVPDGFEPGFTTRDAGLDTLRLQGIPEPVSLVAAVASSDCAFAGSSSSAAAQV